ncbi:MAG: ATP-binding protein [Deltaproteobacteria bacterium]|nr:ATP-binding protein [Deltaproteobacteria bacterium]
MRSIKPEVEATLTDDRKMAFIAGPRQVGKTTLAQAMLAGGPGDEGYYNWDIETHKKMILKDPVYFWQAPPDTPPQRIVLDEIHKYPRWKRFLKGLFDANRRRVEVLVTGSGRLDVYQRGGDSLFGRYHLFHLLPFSVGELLKRDGPPPSPDDCLGRFFDSLPSPATDYFETLWKFGGFPEPFFAADDRKLVQWQNDHRQLVLREDLRDLTQVRELGLVESMIHLLPERIGSPLSINALRESLGVNFKTAQNWIKSLERLYYLFCLRPYSARLDRALRREEKVYFFDWSVLEDPSKRFENMMAVHLLKACLIWTDAGYGQFNLHYVRDKEKREVDFVITSKNRPYLLVEAKLSETESDRSLLYFLERLKPQKGACQIVRNGEATRLVQRGPLNIASAPRFLAAFP